MRVHVERSVAQEADQQDSGALREVDGERGGRADGDDHRNARGRGLLQQLEACPAGQEQHALRQRQFTGEQARENLLVDRLGYLDDAIDRALALAGLDKDEVQVVQYPRRVGAMEALLLGGQARPPRIDLTSLAELAVPKAYYLCTWMPAAAVLARPR